MLRHLLKVGWQRGAAGARRARQDWSLQAILWVVWTSAVVAIGYINWHADVLARRPVNTLGLAVHCAVAGVIGLVVMTVVEMRVQPWRFLDDQPRDQQ